MSEKEEIKSLDKEAIKSGEWELWLPFELIPKRRPPGVVAIYKVSDSLRIFKDSFLGLEGGPGFIKVEEPWKFITIYHPKIQKARGLQLRRQRLGFRLHLEKVKGTLDLSRFADGGFRVSVRRVLFDLDCKSFLDRTCYFKMKYNVANKLHYIELGKPDYEYKKGKGFYPWVEKKTS